jgi:DnaD/phage-associated family protein
MSKFYSLEDVRGDEFYQLPKDLIKNKKYKSLSANAKIAYAILKDRHQVSLKNQWVDEIGVYFLLSDNELAVILDTTIRSASRYKNDLQNFGLIHMERQGLNKRNKIYLLKPEYEAISQKVSEPLVLADRTKLSSPDRTKLSNQDRTELSNQDRTKLSMYSNNNFSNNDFSNEKEEEEEANPLSELISLFSNCIAPANKIIEKRIVGWLEKLPFEVIKAEIEYAALNGGRSWNYVQKSLEQDEQNNFRSVDDVDKKVIEYKSRKKKPGTTTRKPVRTEIIPEWFDEKDSEQNKIVNTEVQDAKKRSIEEKLKMFHSK